MTDLLETNRQPLSVPSPNRSSEPSVDWQTVPSAFNTSYYETQRPLSHPPSVESFHDRHALSVDNNNHSSMPASFYEPDSTDPYAAKLSFLQSVSQTAYPKNTNLLPDKIDQLCELQFNSSSIGGEPPNYFTPKTPIFSNFVENESLNSTQGLVNQSQLYLSATDTTEPIPTIQDKCSPITPLPTFASPKIDQVYATEVQESTLPKDETPPQKNDPSPILYNSSPQLLQGVNVIANSPMAPVPKIESKMRRQYFLETVRDYVAQLHPIDCVVMIERCRPFNSKTRYMTHFKEKYLEKILRNLNGGPPLDADFGRDAYTSLYSLHGFNWHHPYPATTLVSDTPIISDLLKGVSDLHHTERHAPEGKLGTPAASLIKAALREFDTFDRIRKGLCTKTRRHLIILALSPLSLAPLEAEAIALAGGGGSGGGEGGNEEVGSEGVLTELRKRRVAVSVFAPINLPSLRRLADLVNTLPPRSLNDSDWHTVVFSSELADNDPPPTPTDLAPTSWPAPGPPKQQQQANSPCVSLSTSSALRYNNSNTPSPANTLSMGSLQRRQHQPPSSVGDSSLSPQQARSNVQPPSNFTSNSNSGPNSLEPAGTFGLHDVQGPPGSLPPPDCYLPHTSPAAPRPGSFPSMEGAHPNSLRNLPQPPNSSCSTSYPSFVFSTLNSTRSPVSDLQQQQIYEDGVVSRAASFGNLPTGLSPSSDPRQSLSSTASPIRGIGSNNQSSIISLGGSEPCLQQQRTTIPFRSDFPPQNTPPPPSSSGGYQFTPTDNTQRQQGTVSNPSPYAQSPTSVSSSSYPTPNASSQTPYPASAMRDEGSSVSLNQRYQSDQPLSVNSVRTCLTITPGSDESLKNSPLPPQTITSVASMGVIWEGQITMPDAIATVQLSLDAMFASRLNLQWQNNPSVSMQPLQVDIDSPIGQTFKRNMSNYFLQTRLQIAFRTPDQETSMINCLRMFQSESSFTLGVVSPLSHWNNPILSPAGVVVFICLVLADGGRVIGRVPIDSERFQLDLINRQYQRKQPQPQQQQQQQLPQRTMTEKQQAAYFAQYDQIGGPPSIAAPTHEASMQQQQQYPPKLVRQPAVHMGNRTSLIRVKSAGYSPTTPIDAGSVVIRNSESPTEQQLMSQQQQQQQQYALSPQRQQQAWQEQQVNARQPPPVSGLLSSDLMSQPIQTPRPYSGMSQSMMGSGQMQHASYQMGGSGQTSAAFQVRQTASVLVSGGDMCPPGGVRGRPSEVGPRPAKMAYYTNDVVTQQQQQQQSMQQVNARHLRDAAGRFQGNGRPQEFQGGYPTVPGQSQVAGGYLGGPMVNMPSYEMQGSSYRNPAPPPPPTYTTVPRAMAQMRPSGALFPRAQVNPSIIGYSKTQQQIMSGVRVPSRQMQQGGRQAGGIYQTPMECTFDTQQQNTQNPLPYDPNNGGPMMFQ